MRKFKLLKDLPGIPEGTIGTTESSDSFRILRPAPFVEFRRGGRSMIFTLDEVTTFSSWFEEIVDPTKKAFTADDLKTFAVSYEAHCKLNPRGVGRKSVDEFYETMAPIIRKTSNSNQNEEGYF
jgi:hypothetical protein